MRYEIVQASLEQRRGETLVWRRPKFPLTRRERETKDAVVLDVVLGAALLIVDVVERVFIRAVEFPGLKPEQVFGQPHRQGMAARNPHRAGFGVRSAFAKADRFDASSRGRARLEARNVVTDFTQQPRRNESRHSGADNRNGRRRGFGGAFSNPAPGLQLPLVFDRSKVLRGSQLEFHQCLRRPSRKERTVGCRLNLNNHWILNSTAVRRVADCSATLLLTQSRSPSGARAC